MSEFEHIRDDLQMMSAKPVSESGPWWRLQLTEAGIKSDSTWSVNECLKLPGRRQNLVVRRSMFVINRRMLKMKNKRPMIVSHRA